VVLQEDTAILKYAVFPLTSVAAVNEQAFLKAAVCELLVVQADGPFVE
jgi:hypothetical protein